MGDKEFVKLINVSSRMDADILISQLQVVGIETIIKTPGAGDYLNILGYGSALGQDVYVTREDYEVAIEIAKDFKTTDNFCNYNLTWICGRICANVYIIKLYLN